MNYIIKYFSEISVKSPLVRRRMAKQLRDNLRLACKYMDGNFNIQREWDHITIETSELGETAYQEFLYILKNAPGIHAVLEVQSESFETLDDIYDRVYALYHQQIENKTFVVRCKREGEHEFNSHQAEIYIGGKLNQAIESAKVQLKKPEVTVEFEIKKNIAHLVTKRYVGAGGFPLGSLGSVLSLISGGYDSPVASYLAMRRGLSTHYLFFNLGGKAHERGVKEVAYHLWNQFGMNKHVNFITVPFEGVVAELVQKIDNSYMGIILKRMMLRAASEIAKERNYKALVSGEAVAQVSSQTVDNLASIDKVTDTLVMRPLVMVDKSTIIDTAEKIGTAVFAANMPEYCGVISVKPKTRAKIAKIEYEETQFDFTVLEQAIANMKTERIHEMSFDESNTEVEEFAFPLGESVVVDIRHPDEIERKPLKLAQKNQIIHIPFFKLQDEFPSLDNKKTYMLYCDKGVMSRMHAGLLVENQKANVAVYRP